MAEKKRPTLFHGKQAIIEIMRGMTPHQLRVRIGRLSEKVFRLEMENQRLRDSLAKSVDPTDYEALHRRCVAVELENASMIKVLESLRKSLNEAPAGDWVICNVGDLPKELQSHFGIINDARAAITKAREYETAIHGFCDMWRRVDASLKRRILAECDRSGGLDHMTAVTVAARIAKADPDRRPEEGPEKPKQGEIVQFAKPGDRF